jgi:16S rRNA G966 N2-methylase RsmD
MSLQTLSFHSGDDAGMKHNNELPPETITAPRTDPIYNCHAYLTKVPVAAIQPFIESFTEPGDTVADIFAGSGMTGLAAMMANRKAVLSDISVLGQHIACGYLAQVPAKEYRAAADAVMTRARERLGTLYQTRRASDRKMVEITRTVWSFSYRCPGCRAELVYFEHLSPRGAPPKACPKCAHAFERRSWPRGADVPVEVVVEGSNGKLVTQGVSKFDWEMIELAAQDERLKLVPKLVIDQSREMYSRSGLGKAGMTQTSQFFSARNAIALLELWSAIETTRDPAIRQKLKFSFTAILARASRRYQWSAQRPLNAQNQTYYIAPVYYEWNVFELFERKVTAAIRADETLASGDGPLFAREKSKEVSYHLASANKLAHLKDASIDYVFTDPPFGSNIFYSDMSLFHEAWLGKITDNTNEAVVHTTGSRKGGSEQRYESLLREAFSEAFRVLKPGRHMSVVFGNSSGRIWGVVQRALRDAGFAAAPVHVAILDKGQRSVKGLNSGSEGVVTVDLILTVQKPTDSKKSPKTAISEKGDATSLIHEAIAELDAERAANPSYVYAHVLTKAIRKHLLLDNLHLGDVLIALRNAGYSVDKKTGRLLKERAQAQAA